MNRSTVGNTRSRLTWANRLAFIFIFMIINFSPGFVSCAKTSQTSDTEVQQIKDLVDAACKDNSFSGTVMVADDKEVIYSYSCRNSNIQLGTLNKETTKYLVGSNTKGFTATLIMQLVNEGKVSLDGNIDDYLKWYIAPNKNEAGAISHVDVTIRQLLEMSSGIADYTSVPEKTLPYNITFLQPWSTREFVSHFCMPRELKFKPGTRYDYSNSNFFILGAIIEEVTGKAYDEVLQERILDKAELSDTGVYQYTAINDELANGYLMGKSSMKFTQPTSAFSAGYMYSTVNDFIKWNRILYTDTLLPADLRDDMLAPHTPVPGYKCTYYAYGWFVQYLSPESLDATPNCPNTPGKINIPDDLLTTYAYIGYYPDGFCASFYRIPDIPRTGKKKVSLTVFANYGDNSPCTTVIDLSEAIRNILVYGNSSGDSSGNSTDNSK
ncbi:MAG: serine hydrolase [bacterium]|nr:serine hydrolase [bacterium]